MKKVSTIGFDLAKNVFQVHGIDAEGKVLTRAERLRYGGYLRREARGGAILALLWQGMPIKMIARTTGHCRKLVRNVVRGLTGDLFRSRQSSLEAHLPWLESEWRAGCQNGAELRRWLRASGFTGSLRVVGEWATRRRRNEHVPDGAPGQVPSARRLTRLLTITQDGLTKVDAVIVATVETKVPALVEARSLVSGFQAMVRDQRRADLDSWIERAGASLMGSFAAGLVKDMAAFAVALTEPWSNGQTEGQITRLKLVKLQMFGHANLDLLEARLVGGA